ncbi:rhomboid family intramembrane serine protease [Halorarum salinum]|uniref:Rhomboid family intramembrane serine protease n=1 Tax=Halorarum salinum TaxID=2743089 RepID=A0A7D5LC92_9EURY|nr:rhomboid family intramembrane serine protease [Halobaculum salinum]QLG63210.1 rhomboid family intramembrane serine protease [Halobaculum salinum]
MSIDNFPRTLVTFTLAGIMLLVYVVNPAIAELSYIFLAPWMHSGWPHFWNNLFIFVPLGAWVENRVGWLTFLTFAIMIPYLALSAPVAFGYGELSRGASGLTMAVSGYIVPVSLTNLSERLDSISLERRELFVWGLKLLIVLYLAADAYMTVKRFFGFEPRPDGVAVSAHFTGLVTGLLWFAWRGGRHGIFDA